MASLPAFDLRDLDVAPLARAETIPAAWYTAPAFHTFDEQQVMGQTWQYVGAAQQVATPGAYVQAAVAGEPLVVIRDAEGALRAFFNVCRHRGGPLVTEGTGTCRMLQCQYHGWTYRLNGALRGVPRFDRTELFHKEDYGLVPVAVEVWEGMVFVNLAPSPPPLADAFVGIPERIAPMTLASKTFAERVVYDVACNWKVYVDNYLEGYHIPLVHPELCDLLDYRAYVTETFDHYSLQYSPLQAGDNLYQANEGAAYYYYVFPNFMLNILPGRLQTNRVVPVAPDRCQVIFDYYYDEVATPEAEHRRAEDLTFSDRVQQEDADICEHVQRGLASRAYDRGRFSVACEEGVYHFQTLLKQAYRRALDGQHPQ